MPVNSDKPNRWKADIAQSVDLYNDWFMRFAPAAYRRTRAETTDLVRRAFASTGNLTNISPPVLRKNPWLLPILRQMTAPPIARDRLIGLADVAPNLVYNMERKNRLPPRLDTASLTAHLDNISILITRLVDGDLFPWLETGAEPADDEAYRAATIVADRLCGNQADPIIRNTQEARQLEAIAAWLDGRHYSKAGPRADIHTIKPGTFAFHLNVPVRLRTRGTAKPKTVNIPVDAVVMPLTAKPGDLPLLIEAKSAGDYTNPNKRRKEEAIKAGQLRATYGNNVRFILFLRGYFDSAYLGYEAAEGIDWVWEHRIDDLQQFGV